MTSRIGSLIFAALLAGAVSQILSDFYLTLPHLGGGPLFAEVPSQIFAALLVVILFTSQLQPNFALQYIRARRKIWLLELGLLVCSLGAFAIGVLGGALGEPVSLMPMQNVLLFFGLQLGAAALVGWRYSAIAPSLWVLACAMFGRDYQAGVLQPWAFVMSEDPTPAGWTLSALATVLGTTAWLAQGVARRYRLTQ